MLIVVSSTLPVVQEAHYINELFKAGMEWFHLRKPDSGKDEVRRLLDEIDGKYHSMIALHQYHELAREYGINRLHFTESLRKGVSENELCELVKTGYSLSTSIHKASDYADLYSGFAYCFLGPVFNSLSKTGYKSKIDIKDIKHLNNNKIKLIAIGGITKSNIKKSVISAFQGAAVLGTIWHEPASASNTFNDLQELWKRTDR